MINQDVFIEDEVSNYIRNSIKEKGYISGKDITDKFDEGKEVLADLKRSEEFEVLTVDKKQFYLPTSLTLNGFKDLPVDIKDKLIEMGYHKRTTPKCNALDVLKNINVNSIPRSYEERINSSSFVEVITYVNNKLNDYK